MTPDGKYIFAVDFDGTLMKGNTWPDVDGIVDIDLIVYLIKEQDKGHKIILNTCRTGRHLQDAVDVAKAYGLVFDAVNENLPEMIEAYQGDCRKISADFYIDDKAVDPRVQNWNMLNRYNMSLITDSFVTEEKK